MANGQAPSVKRVMVATDRSETANRAVRWAANLAASYQAELLLFQVLAVPAADGAKLSASEDTVGQARAQLRRFAEELAGPRGRARICRWTSAARSCQLLRQRSFVPRNASGRTLCEIWENNGIYHRICMIGKR